MTQAQQHNWTFTVAAAAAFWFVAGCTAGISGNSTGTGGETNATGGRPGGGASGGTTGGGTGTGGSTVTGTGGISPGSGGGTGTGGAATSGGRSGSGGAPGPGGRSGTGGTTGGGRDAGAPDAPSGATGGTTGAGADAGMNDNSAAAQLCVDTINMYRATLGLAPYARWPEEEACASNEALLDSQTNMAHSAFGMCTENAQDECPGWSGSLASIVTGCLAQMWAEGPGTDFATHGHYINMSNPRYTRAACGFATAANGKIWATQDFK